MSAHLERQFDRLKKSVLTLGAMVEEALEAAIRAVQHRDVDLADAVIAGDEAIDTMEIDVEEECLHTLALHQPVAFDLRFVVAVLKINNDLERIADLATNICEQARFLAALTPPIDVPYDMNGMAVKVRDMVKQALDALVNVDPDTAEAARQADADVDRIHRQMYLQVEQAIRDHPDQIKQCLHYLNISRQLERIGDHACNIAEDVLYMARGDISRHHAPGEQPDA